jgi:hypothetical protein
MKEEKEFDPLKVLTIGILFMALILMVLSLIDNNTKPAVKYRINTDGGIYYTNSYQVVNISSGFIELNDYYQGFVWYSHHTTELILQGNIKITEEGKR